MNTTLKDCFLGELPYDGQYGLMLRCLSAVDDDHRRCSDFDDAGRIEGARLVTPRKPLWAWARAQNGYHIDVAWFLHRTQDSFSLFIYNLTRIAPRSEALRERDEEKTFPLVLVVGEPKHGPLSVKVPEDAGSHLQDVAIAIMTAQKLLDDWGWA